MKVAQKQANNDSKRSATETNQSSRQNQLAQVANNSNEAVVHRKFIAGINDSPRMLAQRRKIESYIGTAQQPAHQPHKTGLPDNLKSGIEFLSGLSMDNVRVHYNSPQPSRLNALAYAQDTNIHVAPGQERHLPHEAWHVVQQKQGRVQPTTQAKGVTINDNRDLEREADVMGTKAIQMKCAECNKDKEHKDDSLAVKSGGGRTIQLAKGDSCYFPSNRLSPYANIGEYFDQVGPGENFTDTQMNDIYKANAKGTHSGPVSITSDYISDTTKGALARLTDVNHVIAEVDHIVPQYHWGCNSVMNAQVISSYENGAKGNTYPYKPYSGFAVLDPTARLWHQDKATAIKLGAKNVNNLP